MISNLSNSRHFFVQWKKGDGAFVLSKIFCMGSYGHLSLLNKNPLTHSHGPLRPCSVNLGRTVLKWLHGQQKNSASPSLPDLSKTFPWRLLFELGIFFRFSSSRKKEIIRFNICRNQCFIVYFVWIRKSETVQLIIYGK